MKKELVGRGKERRCKREGLEDNSALNTRGYVVPENQEQAEETRESTPKLMLLCGFWVG